jgi:hypothetical protein
MEPEPCKAAIFPGDPAEKTFDVTSSVEAAKTLILSNLGKAASEILEWRATGGLADGVVARAAVLMDSVYHNDSVGQVEIIVIRETLRFTAEAFRGGTLSDLLLNPGTQWTDDPRDLEQEEINEIRTMSRVEAVRLHRRLTRSTLTAAIRAVDAVQSN